MPRRNYKKRKTSVDPLYKSYEVAKLIRYIMKEGKKTVAQKHVYEMMASIKNKGNDPLAILNQAIVNVSPRHEVKPKRLGGASYLIPIEVNEERKLFLSLKWMIQAAKSRPNKTYHRFSDKLMAEILDASQGQGKAIEKKNQTRKLAQANKAFAHLKW